MQKKKITLDDIDACLPQTQCTLCEYPGCKPYAQAILNKETDIDHCHPGGTKTLHQLASLLNIDEQPLENKVMEQQPPSTVAIIDKETCIGCTKCLDPCPVDAIVGMRKHMHTVIEDACTGCGLCLEPCPMDCISLQPINIQSTTWNDTQANINKKRYVEHTKRIDKRKIQKYARKQKTNENSSSAIPSKSAILEALARAKKNK